MNFLENIKEALRSILGNKLRTILTGLIISIGIMSLVGILTAIESIKASVSQTFSSLGANSFDITSKGYTNAMVFGGRRGKSYPPITYQEAIKYRELFSSDARVSISALVTSVGVASKGNLKSNPNITVMGGDEHYFANQNLNLKYGRDFSASELESGALVVVLGSEVSKKLFEKENPVNEYVSLLGKRFLVIGQLDEKGATLGSSSADRMCIIPLETANDLPRSRALTYDIKTAIANPDHLMYAMGEATGIMRVVRQDALGQDDSFEITRSDSLAKSLDDISGYLRIGGFLVGFITLLGATIGLMNIMLVSVTERTREIGVRKALGATPLQIRQQFLIEAIVICVLGGLLGIFLGVLMGNSVSVLLGQMSFIFPWLWISFGLMICILVGLLSGYYPAYKASKLDPIEALRYE